MDFVIGDRNFNTPDSGGKLGDILVKNQIQRFARTSSVGNPLISLATGASFTWNFQPVGNRRQILLTRIEAVGFFTDSAPASTYIIKEYIDITIASSFIFNSDDSNNLLYYFNLFHYEPNMVLNVNSSNQIAFNFDIDGGTILAQTGVTPGAGDTFDFYVSIGYKLL
jgi:hypothetical protein